MRVINGGQGKAPRKAPDQVRAAGAEIGPLDGWEPVSPYGFQVLDESPWGRLVRLEDVALWLGQTMPRDRVLYNLFRPLLADDCRAADYLWVLSANTEPAPLFRYGAPSPDTAGFWGPLLGVHEDAGSTGDLVRVIQKCWADAWPGASDPETDSELMMDRIAAQNRIRRATDDEDTARDELAPRTASFSDPARVGTLNRLRRLAMPIPKAHALWGWGRAVVPAVEASAPVAAAHVGPINTPEEFKASRATMPKRARWTEEQTRFLRIKLVVREVWIKHPNGRWTLDSNKLNQLAREMGLSGRQALDAHTGDKPLDAAELAHAHQYATLGRGK